MKKKKISIILVAALLLSGCSKSAGNETEQSTAETIAEVQSNTDTVESEVTAEKTELDLHGNWIQEGYETKESYMTASITDDVIEIYWYMDGGNTVALYWSGSFIESDNNDDYTWDSVNDKEKTGMSLMASSDETKTFSYSDGKISYSQSALGVTTTIYLIPNN